MWWCTNNRQLCLRLNKTWSDVSRGNRRRIGQKDHHLQHSCLWYLVYGSAKSYCQFFHFLIPCTVADLPPRTVLTLVDPSRVAAGPRLCSCCAGALRFGHGTSVSLCCSDLLFHLLFSLLPGSQAAKTFGFSHYLCLCPLPWLLEGFCLYPEYLRVHSRLAYRTVPKHIWPHQDRLVWLMWALCSVLKHSSPPLAPARLEEVYFQSVAVAHAWPQAR